MKSNRPTYTLWQRGDLLKTFDHTRAGMDDAMEMAHELVTDDPDGLVEIYSSRDDLVWSGDGLDEPNEPSDAWHDADALASAGMGTDEDYGYYGDDSYEW